MSIDSTWLRCPNCFLDLSPVDDRTFGCETGHRFDRAKHGYLTLLPPKAPRTIGDDPGMLRARSELLGSGAFTPISDALIEAVGSSPAVLRRRNASDAGTRARVADLGCGTGHYSAELSRSLPELEFLLADRSPDAMRASLRVLPAATGIVLDIWRPLPIRTGAVDVILNVFAPRNLDEFARVLRPGGSLIIVVPTERHLHELRHEGLVLEIPSGKSSRLIEQFTEAGFALRSNTPIEYTFGADAGARRLLADMGPSAHHAEQLAHDAVGVLEPTDTTAPVTASVEIVSFESPAPA